MSGQHCYLGDFYEEYYWMDELDKLDSVDVYFGTEKLLDLLLRPNPTKAFELIKKHGYRSKGFYGLLFEISRYLFQIYFW